MAVSYLLESSVLLAVCGGYLGWDLRRERHFVDESAYISQSFYADLYVSGRWDHPAWLDYAAYDLPPLPKYWIGLALWGDGLRRPTIADAHRWYMTGNKQQFAGTPLLVSARRPAVVLGAVGCLGLYWLGCLLGDRRVGGIAAGLLAINPLYRMHARRAMSDVSAEAFLILGLVFGLIAWQRAARQESGGRSWLLVVLAGGMVGLATLSKLNGVLSGIILGVWIVVALVARSFTPRAKWFLVLAGPVAAGLAFATFVALDPYLIARPPPPVAPEIAPEAARSFLGRTRAVYDHRATVSRIAMQSFPHNALPTLPDKIAAVLVQGFGRFGPFGPRGWTDSTIRFDLRQDWGAILWLPLVGSALVVVGRQGWRQSREHLPPQSWLPLAYFAVVAAVVTPFIPLAWDRYFLSLQAPSCLVVAILVAAALDRKMPRRPGPAEVSR